ncbi:MAG: hypothetical protein C5S47_00780 [Candidatus Methanogasteraceae archaeon]|nr:MAG: hypothetical protein C5S47_00780 [ANME-2 cluster archaeon]
MGRAGSWIKRSIPAIGLGGFHWNDSYCVRTLSIAAGAWKIADHA